MPPSLTRTELAAWQALLQAHQDLTRRLEAELQREHMLTLSEYEVLRRLARTPDHRLRMSELAGQAMLSPSALTRAVDRLERDGLVLRRRDGGDGRLVMACLSELGDQRLCQAARTYLRSIRKHFTGRLTETQLVAVAEALQVICGTLRSH